MYIWRIGDIRHVGAELYIATPKTHLISSSHTGAIMTKKLVSKYDQLLQLLKPTPSFCRVRVTTLELELPGDCATNLFTVVAPGLVSRPQCGPGAGTASLDLRGPATLALVLLISQQGARWRLRYP